MGHARVMVPQLMGDESDAPRSSVELCSTRSCRHPHIAHTDIPPEGIPVHL